MATFCASSFAFVFLLVISAAEISLPAQPTSELSAERADSLCLSVRDNAPKEIWNPTITLPSNNTIWVASSMVVATW